MKKEKIFNYIFELSKNVNLSKLDNSISLECDGVSIIEINLNSFDQLFWPNREGELIKTSNILKVLDDNKLSKASICYPATASMNLFILYNEKLCESLFIYSKSDKEGKLSLFSLLNKENNPYLKIESSNIEFKLLTFKGNRVEETIEKFVKANLYKTILPKRDNKGRYQVQVGMFSPYGETNVPLDKGFNVLDTISSLMKEYINNDNILHLFAYHGSHDSKYPNYFPSEILGGSEKLKNSIAKIHENKQRCSLYMNARLFDSSLLDEYKYLEDSIVRDVNKKYVVETYYDRDFFVMNPESEDWRNLLVERASYLKTLGCDIIQLDQVAGRAAIGPIGTKWGSGYRDLIKSIQSLDLEVWIQGINEIYQANRFELCFRYPNILEDGTIRGGHPFGSSYPLVPRLLENQNFIIPLASKTLIENIDRDLITIDLENKAGQLSLYSESYIKNLINNLKMSVVNG
jgi:hypothetical protein